MMRIFTVFSLAGLAFALIGFTSVIPTEAASASATMKTSAATELSAQSRRRPLRLRVYRPGYGSLPPTAKRDCHAWYEQEHRPSGTVIVPRMRCHWING
jgi:hypothetical protein